MILFGAHDDMRLPMSECGLLVDLPRALFNPVSKTGSLWLFRFEHAFFARFNGRFYVSHQPQSLGDIVIRRFCIRFFETFD